MKALQKYHASHDCDPGQCLCICGCDVQMGCRALGGLCSRCHIAVNWGEDGHDFPPASKVRNDSAQAKKE